MGDIFENKIWIDRDTCLTMAESIESFIDVYDNKNVYDKKGSDNTIIISGIGRIHLPEIEIYPLYLKGTINANPNDWDNYYICDKEEYINAVKQKIDECKKELNYYEELLDTAKGEK